MAPQVGLEPTTNRLTADCSTDWAIEECLMCSVSNNKDYTRLWRKKQVLFFTFYLLYSIFLFSPGIKTIKQYKAAMQQYILLHIRYHLVIPHQLLCLLSRFHCRSQIENTGKNRHGYGSCPAGTHWISSAWNVTLKTVAVIPSNTQTK